MKAVVFDGKSLSLKYDENYPMPALQKDDDVIVKVEYSGVCGTDLHIIQVHLFHYFWYKDGIAQEVKENWFFPCRKSHHEENQR